MQPDPYEFGLWVHTDRELGEFVGADVVSREPLQQPWPLSIVEKVQFSDGTTSVYKAQWVGSLEPRFYSRVRSPLLLAHRVLPGDGDGRPPALLLEYVDAVRLSDAALAAADSLALVDRVLTQIRAMKDDPPVAADIGSTPCWQRFADGVLHTLDALVADGLFITFKADQARGLRDWSRRSDIAATAADEVGLVHGDLKPDNVLLLRAGEGVGCRVVDWARPWRGPAALDRVHAAVALGLDPASVAPAAAVQLYWFTKLSWLAECKARWYPSGGSYDAQAAEVADRILSA